MKNVREKQISKQEKKKNKQAYYTYRLISGTEISN